MDEHVEQAVHQVLDDAGNAPRLRDLPDGERLNCMIARAFTLGISTNQNGHQNENLAKIAISCVELLRKSETSRGAL